MTSSESTNSMWRSITFNSSFRFTGETMTQEKKRRQGQIKPDGTQAEPKKVCPDCGAYLQNAYIKKRTEGKRVLVVIGLACPDCDYINRIKLE